MKLKKKNWKRWSTIVSWILILEQSVSGLTGRTILVKSKTFNKTLGTLENEILKFCWKLWSTIVFWILILEQNVLGFIDRTILVWSRTLNGTLGTLENEI